MIGGFSVLFRILLVDWKVHRLMKADDEDLNILLKTQIVKDYPAPRKILTEHRIAIVSVIKFINAEHCRSSTSNKQSFSLRLLAACACVIATSITGISLFFKIDVLRS